MLELDSLAAIFWLTVLGLVGGWGFVSWVVQRVEDPVARFVARIGALVLFPVAAIGAVLLFLGVAAAMWLVFILGPLGLVIAVISRRRRDDEYGGRTRSGPRRP